MSRLCTVRYAFEAIIAAMLPNASSEAELVAVFERGEIDAASFHHRDHIQVAWCYLRVFDLAEAAGKFIAALQRFAAANGVPQLYHATITWAYLVAINERMHRDAAPDSWEAFAAANADLFAWKPSFLDTLYRPETLASAHAKRVFVLPDRSPAGRG